MSLFDLLGWLSTTLVPSVQSTSRYFIPYNCKFLLSIGSLWARVQENILNPPCGFIFLLGPEANVFGSTDHDSMPVDTSATTDDSGFVFINQHGKKVDSGQIFDGLPRDQSQSHI